MELRLYAAILNRRKWVILVTAVVTLVVVAVGTSRMTPIYSASAVARVAGAYGTTVNTNDLNYGERLRETYVFLLKSRPFLEEVAGRLGLGQGVADLASAIKVESLPNTELIRVTVSNRDPRQAAAIANMLTVLLIEQGQKVYAGEGKSAREILLEQLANLESRLGDDRTLLANLSAIKPDPDAPKGGSPVELAARIRVEEQTYATLLSQYEKARTDEAMRANSISVAEPAVVPLASNKPNRKLNLVLGALVGLLGGLGLALLFENLDPSTHSAADLPIAGTVPVLGQIPTFLLGKGDRRPIATSTGGAGQASASEAFKVLAVNTLAVMTDRQPRTLMLSSAEPGAGKSLLTANLAAALAQTGLRVILVDGDLHHPRLHTLFDLPREPGLSDVVRDPGKLDGTLQTTPALGVQLLASGSSRAAQGNLYHMPSMSQVMQALATRADIVLWDSPPILAAADATVLATQVQGVILVAARDHTSRRSLALALEELQQVGAQALGVIYNRATLDGAGYYYRSYHRQADAPSAEAPPAANTQMAAAGRRH